MTHEEKAIKKIGSFYVVNQMAEIESTTLNTTIDELLIPVRDKYSISLIDKMYDYILLQKQLIEQLAGQIKFQEEPEPEQKFFPMSKPVRKRF